MLTMCMQCIVLYSLGGLLRGLKLSEGRILEWFSICKSIYIMFRGGGEGLNWVFVDVIFVVGL